ncbi:bMERB domain-containing protein 1-like isoform X3 [Lethenteron reissneri]|uniref:bMERB domain-containing protein 1-like isoform X3 n=1 Tax=Lethenteron reissneri TaxID=7753 RepID=UPI002AB640EB|nr:bMERB domain-containing protein 1-like isoform X3 [Lethenteron reissneri]
MEAEMTPPRALSGSRSGGYGAMDDTSWGRGTRADEEAAGDVVSMADSTATLEELEEELVRIERLREQLVRRESELRYMMDDMQLCQEISRLKAELQALVSLPDAERAGSAARAQEESLIRTIHELVEKRDYLVDDVELERLREREEDKEMSDFLQKKLRKKERPLRADAVRAGDRRESEGSPQGKPTFAKTGLTLLKDCCGLASCCVQ